MTTVAPFLLLPLAAVAAVTPAPSAPGTAGPDIRSIVPPQPFYIEAGGVWLVIAGACAALAAVALWFWLRRPKKATPGQVYTPRQIAARRLQELETQMDALDARAFGNAVADVLRVYIGAHYGLQPERQTSEEFLASIGGARTFSVVEHALLREFLGGCDLLKFARADATLAGKRRLLVQALEFLEGSAQVPAAAAAPGPGLTPAA